MVYLMWHDDNPKHALTKKIADGCEAYRSRFGVAPTLALISPEDGPVPSDAPVAVQIASGNAGVVRKNIVWIGME
jgi:hypothetical protein